MHPSKLSCLSVSCTIRLAVNTVRKLKIFTCFGAFLGVSSDNCSTCCAVFTSTLSTKWRNKCTYHLKVKLKLSIRLETLKRMRLAILATTVLADHPDHPVLWQFSVRLYSVLLIKVGSKRTYESEK